MLVTSIFSFSHNVFKVIDQSLNHGHNPSDLHLNFIANIWWPGTYIQVTECLHLLWNSSERPKDYKTKLFNDVQITLIGFFPWIANSWHCAIKSYVKVLFMCEFLLEIGKYFIFHHYHYLRCRIKDKFTVKSCEPFLKNEFFYSQIWKQMYMTNLKICTD